MNVERMLAFLLPYRCRSFRERAITIAGSCARKKFRAFFCHEELRRVLDAILHFFQSLYSSEGLKELIHRGGAPLVCTIVFIETGFFVGFFLPGDSLLVTAGIFAALPDGIPSNGSYFPSCFARLSAIRLAIGSAARRAPLSIAARTALFRRSHLQRAHDFYEKYGGRAVILARLHPHRSNVLSSRRRRCENALLPAISSSIFVEAFYGWARRSSAATALGKFGSQLAERIHYVIAVVIVLSVLPRLSASSVRDARPLPPAPRKFRPCHPAKFRAIIFDIGRVLIRVDITAPCRSFRRPPSSPPRKCGPPSKTIPLLGLARGPESLRKTGISISASASVARSR